MDTKKWEALLTAVERGSLTKAAEALGYTQSGMTHMMHALEAEAGLTLLLRSRGGVRLSPAGQRLLPRIHALAEASRSLEEDLRRVRGSQASTIRVGAYSSIAQHWLPQLIQAYRRLFTDVDVMVSMFGVEELYAAVRDGGLDCALVSRQASLSQGLGWVPLRNDELEAVLPAEYPVNGTLFPVAGFDNREFLMPTQGFEMDIDPVFAEHGVHPRIRRTNFDDAVIVSMVEHGLGISILSELVMRGRGDRVKALPLTPPAYRELGLIFRQSREGDRLVRGFIGCAQSTVMALYQK